MRRHSPFPGDARLRLVALEGPETAIPPRFFSCAKCRGHAFVCSRCDRGQIYCARGCAGEARRAKQREAKRRYQRTLRGRRKHAARMVCYRARRNKVTHHGSPQRPPSDVFSSDLATVENEETSSGEPVAGDRPAARRGHWCACRCPDRVRHEFLRRRWVHSIVETDRTGHENDDTS